MAVERWPSADRDMRSRMAHMASAASWGLGKETTLCVDRHI